MPRRDDDRDDTPIRRLTRKPKRSRWVRPVVAVMIVAGLVSALALAVSSVPVSGARLHKEAWWTSGATPGKIQRIVDELSRHDYRRVELYYNSDADYTICTGISYISLLSSRSLSRWANQAETPFGQLLDCCRREPYEFSNPDVIESGTRLELKYAVGGDQPRQRVVEHLTLDLKRPPLFGSGRSHRRP